MKGDWLYIDSGAIGQRIALDRRTGWIFCEDGTRYSPAELAALTAAGVDGIPPEVHAVKNAFGGELVAAGDAAAERGRRG